MQYRYTAYRLIIEFLVLHMERVWHSVRLIVPSQRDVNIEAYQIREIRAVMELSEAAPKAAVFDLDQLRHCQESLDDGTNEQTCVDALL